MTDEEMAEEYIKKNNLEWELECNRTSPIGEVKQAFLAGLKACEEKIELMKCCQNCKHFDFDEPKYCHKGVYNCAYVCDKYELGN